MDRAAWWATSHITTDGVDEHAVFVVTHRDWVLSVAVDCGQGDGAVCSNVRDPWEEQGLPDGHQLGAIDRISWPNTVRRVAVRPALRCWELRWMCCGWGVNGRPKILSGGAWAHLATAVGVHQVTPVVAQ